MNDTRLVKALRRAFRMIREDAEATARVVSSVFRGDDEVNDEDLDKEVRALFYTLEREQLLGIRRTEYKFEGQTRRAYFWRLNPMEVPEDDERVPGLSRQDLEAARVYRTLPQEVWTRAKN